RLRQRPRNWGDAPLPCLLTRGQAPSTHAAREGKHVLPNSFYGNGGTKFPKTAERRLSLGSSSPARTAIWNKQPRSRDYSAFRMRAEDAALLRCKHGSKSLRQNRGPTSSAVVENAVERFFA